MPPELMQCIDRAPLQSKAGSEAETRRVFIASRWHHRRAMRSHRYRRFTRGLTEARVSRVTFAAVRQMSRYGSKKQPLTQESNEVQTRVLHQSGCCLTAALQSSPRASLSHRLEGEKCCGSAAWCDGQSILLHPSFLSCCRWCCEIKASLWF